MLVAFCRAAGEDALPNSAVYRGLIFHRYDETLSSAFPLFKARAGDAAWEEMVELFVERGANTPFIWQMPAEFINFLLSREGERQPYWEELLWFEWQQVALCMKHVPPNLETSVDFERIYTLGGAARVRRFVYPVMRGEIAPEGEYWLLIYQDIAQGTVVWETLTPFMGRLLDILGEARSLRLQVEALSAAFGIASEDAFEILSNALKRYLEISVMADKEQS